MAVPKDSLVCRDQINDWPGPARRGLPRNYPGDLMLRLTRFDLRQRCSHSVRARASELPKALDLLGYQLRPQLAHGRGQVDRAGIGEVRADF